MAKKNSSILWTVYQSGGNNTADVIGNQGRITAQDNIGLGDGFIKATETHKYVTNVSRDANSGKLLVNVAQPTLSDLQGMGSNSANKAIVTAGDNDLAQNGTLIAKTLTATKVSSDSTTNVFVSDITEDGQGNITFTTKTLSTATTSAIGGVKSTTTGTTSGRDYYVQVESNGKMKVNVPWENNTHYDSKTVICKTNNGTANTAVTSSETVYLNHVENGGVVSSHKILGTNCNITADSSGHLTIAPVITAGSNVSINSSNVISATDTTYTAGTNVQINSSNVISATDTTYSAGSGITLTGTTFSADKSVMQEKLTAGSNVQINNNVISATDTTYTAGDGISINTYDNNTIRWVKPTGFAEATNLWFEHAGDFPFMGGTITDNGQAGVKSHGYPQIYISNRSNMTEAPSPGSGGGVGYVILNPGVWQINYAIPFYTDVAGTDGGIVNINCYATANDMVSQVGSHVAYNHINVNRNIAGVTYWVEMHFMVRAEHETQVYFDAEIIQNGSSDGLAIKLRRGPFNAVQIR